MVSKPTASFTSAEKDESHQPVLDVTLPLLAKKRAASEDLPALLILARRLYDIKRPDIRHVVIDEAQDVSPLEVKALRDLAGTDAFTLVGDLCQGIYGDEGLRSWEALSRGIFDESPHVAHLSTAYRSTVEIMETAFAVMERHPVQGAGEAKPVLRHGPAPIHLPVPNDKARPEAIARQVERWQAEGFGNMALIVKTEKAAKALHKALAALIPEAKLVLSGDESFEGGVQVMDASLVKGLEFDCVLIADADDHTYPDERFYAKLFYVLCTRPLHRLAFVYAGECTKHLTTCQNDHPAV